MKYRNLKWRLGSGFSIVVSSYIEDGKNLIYSSFHCLKIIPANLNTFFASIQLKIPHRQKCFQWFLMLLMILWLSEVTHDLCFWTPHSVQKTCYFEPDSRQFRQQLGRFSLVWKNDHYFKPFQFRTPWFEKGLTKWFCWGKMFGYGKRRLSHWFNRWTMGNFTTVDSVGKTGWSPPQNKHSRSDKCHFLMVICETRLFCSVLAALGGCCHMTFQANSLYLRQWKKNGTKRYTMLCTKSAEAKMDVS